MRINELKDVVDWRLCVGCGLCAYLCPDNVKLKDIVNDGIRPEVLANGCGPSCECLQACPGLHAHHDTQRNDGVDELRAGWGPVLELFEGYAADPELRFRGSSAGLATALALYCLEREEMYGVLHIEGDANEPWRNRTVLSRDRDVLLRRTGSRYAPASPCDSLHLIENAPRPCIFIGKPCDVTGLRNAMALRPQLSKKVGVAIGIFCAGTPSTQGTLDLLQQLEVDSSKVEEIRYRGNGWPGNYSARLQDEEQPRRQLSYKASWSFLQEYRPFRCHLCPDGTSEFADISCGDPWYREIHEDEPGLSLVVVRTPKGREIVRRAIESGYVVLQPAESNKLEAAQKNLLAKRSAIWGRLLAMKIFGIPAPKYVGFSLLKNWMRLPLPEKLRSVLGTTRRIMTRRYFLKRNDHRIKAANG